MMEIERPDLYAMIHGYGQPGMTEGFQCWNRARGVWGPPETYEGREDKWNPYKRCGTTAMFWPIPAGKRRSTTYMRYGRPT